MKENSLQLPPHWRVQTNHRKQLFHIWLCWNIKSLILKSNNISYLFFIGHGILCCGSLQYMSLYRYIIGDGRTKNWLGPCFFLTCGTKLLKLTFLQGWEENSKKWGLNRWGSIPSITWRNIRLHFGIDFFLQNKFKCFILPRKERWWRVPRWWRRWRRAPLHRIVQPIRKIWHWQFYWFWVASRGFRNLNREDH